MTKLSERVPKWSGDARDLEFGAAITDWLKELAEYAEFIDRRVQMESRYLCIHRTSSPTPEVKTEYEPQTYDEAIALIKGWKRCVVGDLVRWELSSEVGDRFEFEFAIEYDFGAYVVSWEKHKWPDLWKEMVEAKIRKLYLSEISDEWVFNLDSRIYTDSTPGRVVCKAYIVYKGHPDWAERLSND